MIVGILLAAGQSSRFGSNKLLHALEGVPVVVRAAQCLVSLQQSLAVVPDDSSPLCAVLQQNPIGASRPNLTVVSVTSADLKLVSMVNTVNMGPDPPRGQTPYLLIPSQSLSLRSGLMGSADAAGWIVALGDMPWVQSSTVSALREALEQGADIVVPCYQGSRGNPVGFSRRYWNELMALRGDEGARSLLQRHALSITWVDVEDKGILQDVDLLADVFQNS